MVFPSFGLRFFIAVFACAEAFLMRPRDLRKIEGALRFEI